MNRPEHSIDITGRTILVVDDEPQIRRALRTNLSVRGHHVIEAGTGEEALRAVAEHHPDLVLLDLGLPGIDGIQVLHGLRGWTGVPVIVLTVRDREHDKVEALDAGADDYVTKPFGMNELLARMRAQLRRNAAATPSPVVASIRTDDFIVDLIAGRVTNTAGDDLHLTPKEWGIVSALAKQPGRLVLQRDLLRDVWGPDYGDEANYLRVFMAQIRKKIEPDPHHPRYFITEPGLGYRFENVNEQHVGESDKEFTVG